MTTIQQMHPRYSIGFQDAAATAANAALWAGQEAIEDAREAWALVRESFGSARGLKPLAETSQAEQVARRIAVRLEQRAGKTIALASSSACGLWALEDGTNRIFEVESTNGGSEYLTQVRFVRSTDLTSGVATPTMERYADEYPLSAVLAFFDSYEAAHEFRSR